MREHPDNDGAGDFRPDWRVHPGEILRDALEERGISQSALARSTGYTFKHINRIVNGHVDIVAPLAVALERELGIRAELWMTAQVVHDLHEARERDGDLRRLAQGSRA